MISPIELKALKARNAEAITGIVRDHTRVLLGAALGMGFPESEAEELVQAALVAFFEGLDRFEGRSSVRTYLFGILIRKAKERWRKQSREVPIDPVDDVFERRFSANGMWQKPPEGPEEELLTEETGTIIEQCLKDLHSKQRAAFHLKEVERESTDSICNILGITVTHLGVLLFRARNNLRECLERKWGE